MDLVRLLLKGGVLIYPIMLVSLLGLVLAVERLFALRRERILPRGMKKRVLKLVRAGKGAEAQKVLEGNSTPLGILLGVTLRSLQKPRQELVGLLEERGRRIAHRMGRSVDFIGVMAAIAPLLGLLGTVTGMISVFRNVMTDATVKGVNPASLASGIWEALITTAAGLSVAIPLFLLHRYLASRVDTLVIDLEDEVLTAVDTLKEEEPAR